MTWIDKFEQFSKDLHEDNDPYERIENFINCLERLRMFGCCPECLRPRKDGCKLDCSINLIIVSKGKDYEKR